MKQSQNAITFLTAQYRSVYGRAYVKGLASAVAISSAFLAPQVSAENIIDGFDSFDSFDNITGEKVASDGNTDYTINPSLNKFGTLRVTGNSAININGGESAHIKNYLSVHGDGTVNIGTSGASGSNAYIYGSEQALQPNQQLTQDLTVQALGTINIGSTANQTNGIVYANNVDTAPNRNGTVTIEGRAGNWDEHSRIHAAAGLSSTDTVRKPAGFNIQGRSSFNLKDNGALVVDTGGTMNIHGSGSVNLSGSEAFLRGADNFTDTGFDSTNTESGGIISLSESGSINVTSNNAGIYAPTVNISGGSVNVSAGGVLNLDGDMIKAGTSLADAGHAAADITVTGGIIKIEEGGKVVVGRGTYGTTDPAWTGKEQTTLTVSNGGQISGAGTLEVQGTANLTQNVLDGFTGTTGTTGSNSGKVVLSGGILQLSATDPATGINLSGYTFANSTDGNATAAQISVNANGEASTVEANKIKIANSIGNNDTLNLNVKAQTLELTSETDPAANNLGFNSAIVSNNVTFDATNSDDKKFHLQNKVVLADTQNDGVRSSGDLVVEDVYQVAAGEGNHTGNITLAGKSPNSSTFKIGGGDSNASFIINSGTPNTPANFTIDNTSGSNNIIVAAKDGYTATLDFGTNTASEVNLTLNRDTTNANITKIEIGDATATAPVDGASKVILTSSDFTEVINFNANSSAGTGAYVVLNDGGEMNVQGTTVDTPVDLYTAQLDSGTGTGVTADAATDKIFFNGGRFYAQDIRLTESGSKNVAINGTVAADNLVLTGQADNNTNLVVDSGTLEVHNSLTTNSAVDPTQQITEIQLTGNSGESKLVLNASDVGPHALGTNISLNTSNGTGTGTAVFNVSNGTWQAADPINDKLTVTATGTGSTINVGDGNHDLRANLNVNDLSVTNGAILNISSDGQVAVNGGTADFSNNGVVSGMGILAATNGTVKMTQDTLNNFVGLPATEGEANPDLGQVVLTDSTLDLSDGVGTEVDLSNYIITNNNTNNVAEIVINDGEASASSIIKADNLAISKDLATTPLDLNLEANKITLGDGNTAFNAGNDFKSASASEIVFKNTATDDVVLDGNVINVVAANGSGSSTGNVYLTNNSEYNVEQGSVTHSGDMTLAGGSIKIGNGDNVNFLGQDASLNFAPVDATGPAPVVTFDNSNGAQNKITVVGNGYDVNAPNDYGNSVLDLTGVDLSVTRGDGSTQIVVGSTTPANGASATVKINDTNFNKLIEQTPSAEGTGAVIAISDTGTVLIEGSGSVNLNASQLQSGDITTGSSDTIFFNGEGTLVGENFNITAASDPAQGTTDNLNIGSGTLRVNQALDLRDNGTDATSFTVAGGNIEVGNKLTSNNTSIKFNASTGNNVSLVLGNASTTTGEVNTSLEFTGTDTNTASASASINNGSWTVKDISADKANVIFGQGQGTVANVTISGGSININNGSTLAVNTDADATFDQLNLSGGSTATITGKFTAQNQISGNANSDAIKVSGGSAYFGWGDGANNQITHDATTNEIVVNEAKDLFTVTGGAELDLNLDNSFNLTREDINKLRSELIAGPNDQQPIDGVINLGAASIDGIEYSDIDGSLSVSEGDLTDIKLDNDITTDNLKNAILVDVDENSTVNRHVGSIIANTGVTQVTIGNGNLYNSSINDGKFVTNRDGNDVQTIIVNESLGLHNGGSIQDIKLNTQDSTLFVEANDDQSTNIASVKAGDAAFTNTTFNLAGTGTTNVSGAVDVANLVGNNGHTLNVGDDLKVTTETSFNGAIAVNKNASFSGNTYLKGDNVFNGDASFDSSVAENNYTLLEGNNTFKGNAGFNGQNHLAGDNQFTSETAKINFTGDNNLQGANTFKGDVSFTSSGTDLNNNATENILAGNNTFEGNVNFSGTTTISGDNKFTNSASTATFSGSSTLVGNNTFAGNTVFDSTGTNAANEANKTVLEGNNTFSKDATFTGDTTLTGNNTFDGAGSIVSFSGTNTITGSNSFEGSGSTIHFSGDTTLTGSSVNGVGSGNVFAADTKVNFTGNTTLAGSNTFNGGVYFDSTQGTVAGTSGSTTIAGSTFNGTTDFKGETKLNGSNTFASGATFNDATTISGGNIFNGGASFSGTAVISDNNTFSGTTVFGDKAEISGNNTFADVKYDTTATQIKNTISGNMTANSITFNGTDNTLHVQNGNVKVANAVTVSGTGNVLQVGSDGTTSTLGTLEAENIVLGGNTLFVDPNYGESTALVAVKNGYVSATEPSDGAPSVVDGNIIIGKNSAVGLGTDLSHLQEQIGLYQENGSLDITGPGNVEGGTGFGSILYLGEATKVGDGNRIVVNSSNSAVSLDEVQNFGSGADLALSANSAIIIDRNAFGTDQSQTAISFDKAGAQVYSEGGKIVLTGNYDASKALNVLNDSEGDGVTIAGSDIVVESQNKLFKGTLEQGDNKGTLNLQLQEPALRALNTISDPAKQFLIDKAYSGSPYAQAASLGDTTAIDKAARMGAYSAAAQTALAVNQTMEQAIAARMGMGYGDGQGGSVSFSPTNGRGGFWATPIYRRINGDGFDAQGIDYGADIDMYGLTGGVDIKLTKDIYTGAVLAFGTGSADGNGMASSTSNDFDYFGFGAYLGYRFKNLTVLGDINYSQVDNSVEDTNGVDKISASFDSTNLSLGVSGKLDFKVGNVNVAPHAGLRFSRIEVDDFGVNGAQYGLVANTSNSTLNIFSVPVGVIIASDFKVNDWMLRPSLDFTLQGNFGDDSLDSSVNFIGSSAGAYDFSSEVLDNFTYGLTAGLNVRKDNFNFGIGLNYTGSSNVNEFGIKANARLDF